VREFKSGDRVYTWGSISGVYAERSLCTEAHLHPLPDNVDFKQGAALGVPYATAYRALFQKAFAQPSETVLIHGGSGGVGIAAIQLALAAGCKVIATAGSEAGRALVASQGKARVLDHSTSGYLEQIKSLTADHGVDVIVEMLANSNLANDLEILAPKGRVIIVGSRGPIAIDPRHLMGRDASITGMVLFNAQENELKSIHAAIIAGLSNATLRPVIGREFSLGDAALAHRRMMEERSLGKTVLIP
jgi:NADPH2:quinone reductase